MPGTAKRPDHPAGCKLVGLISDSMSEVSEHRNPMPGQCPFVLTRKRRTVAVLSCWFELALQGLENLMMADGFGSFDKRTSLDSCDSISTSKLFGNLLVV